MARPRRSAARKAEAQRVAECDGGTALELVEPDAEQRQSDEPEEIDTEEDDSEFDERAHWGRRRTRPQKNDSNTKKKLKKTAEDKAQPKINLFCVLQSATNVSDDAVVQEGDGEVTVKSGEMEVEPRNVRDQVHTVHSVNEDPTLEPSAAGIEITEDSNGGSSVEVLVAASANVAPQNGDQEVASVLTGRPKRQARVRAEEAQAQANLFTTPPSAPSRRPSSASRATLDGEADKKTSSGTSSARKRKLEMAGEKKKNASNAVPIGGSTKVRTPSSVFFLTEEQKKQVIEIEAVASFKEQLKQQRERDLEFFGQRVVKNPFFEARMGSQKSIDGENGKCEEIIDLSDSPRTSPVKSKSRWSSMPLEFPSLQHSIPDSSEANATRSAFALPLKKPTPNERPCVIDLDDEDMESNRFFSHKAFKFATDTADMQVAFDDAFWLMAAPTSNDGDDLLPCSLSTDQLVEMLANMYGFTEKRVRKTLVALEAASAKRQSKSSNLSFVDRYLPVEKNGMIGNRPALKKLSSWLGAWKTGSDNRDRRYDDDLFAFEGDDSEEDEDGSRLYKLFVLKGDSGSGKSAVVYACAEELGYEIIEINAGQLRTGKAIVDIAGEATQSTRVLHSGDTKKKAKSSKKRRKEADSSKPSHLSLVLFEDVDLVFDEDKGFLSTLSSIAKHSKCPIVATCTDIPDNFPSVPPAITECISRPSPKEFALFLTLVAHLELIPVTRGILDRLGQLYCYDVRRSLQFLQTYRHQISCFNSRNHDRLLWKPALHSEGSDRAPISIDASQDDQRLSARPVAGWSTCPRRSFDLLTSNLLPSLEASQFAIEDHKTASREEKEAVVQHLGDVWSILDTASMANEWENSFEQRHTAFPSLGPEADDSFFHKEDVCLLCLDLRMLGLGSLFTGNDDSTSLKELRLRETNIQDAVTRALQLRHDEEERVIKVSKLADLKAKLNLPITVKGCGLVDASFSSDYIPMVARILESSEPLQESRRRASRRNHYLRDVLPDMSLADDIREFHGYSSCAQEPCETASLPKPSPMACAAASGTSILI